MTEIIEIYFDGACKLNPGLSGSAFWNETDQCGGYKYLGLATNNVAEYNAVILALEHLISKGYNKHTIKVYGDSNLVIQQMNGKWQVKALNLKPLWEKATKIAKNFEQIEFIHVDRSLNSKADKLANLSVETKNIELILT